MKAQQYTRDMLMEVTAEAEKWFNDVQESLSRAGNHKRKVKASVEAIASGAIDFKAAAQETRHKMQAKFEKGQSRGRKKK